ncbi:MAG: hypothetical protein ABIQ04_01100 [Candidatus Saccharimonadales bacterium]
MSLYGNPKKGSLVTTTDQLFSLQARQNEISRRLKAGSLTVEDVLDATQGILDGIYPTKKTTDSIVQWVERQLARWEELGVVIDEETRERILQQADVFKPFTDTDTPLVSGGFGYTLSSCFGRLWDAFVPPAGYTKYRYPTAETPLKYAAGMKPTGVLRLVHFDPNGYQGKSPKDALSLAKKDKVRLASIEVLEKLVLDPDWAMSWDGKGSPYPKLSGLQAKYGSDWSNVPYVNRWVLDLGVNLNANDADNANDNWSSPVVRDYSK